MEQLASCLSIWLCACMNIYALCIYFIVHVVKVFLLKGYNYYCTVEAAFTLKRSLKDISGMTFPNN